VIETALGHGADLLFVLWSGLTESPSGLLPLLSVRGIEIVEVSPDEFAEFAQTETPQGVLALAREPRVGLPSPEDSKGERVLLLDRVQDPGNVGTLIRAAAALDVDRVIVLDGTADPWGAKALRASSGLAFRLPIHALGWAEAADWITRASLPLLVAHGPGEDVRMWLARRSEGEVESAPVGPVTGWVLLIGNEGDGPRQEAFERADALLSIPLREGVESLNAAMAGAILLWSLGPGRARTA
jgi:TrmH family RNA methyltransferase